MYVCMYVLEADISNSVSRKRLHLKQQLTLLKTIINLSILISVLF